MPLAEFSLIDRYFRNVGPNLDSTLLGIGDDCAVLRPPVDQALLVTTDTLVENTHFLAGVDPEALGYKALAVNLSDLAAMGATPRWVTLALTLPNVNEPWLDAFARGFSVLALQYRVQLVGGDTTQGPLSITVQAIGTADEGQVLRRSTARPGDRIYVTGTLGDAGLALKYTKDPQEFCSPTLQVHMDRPRPRIEAGRLISCLASACIDISDGFGADLGHLLKASHVGATVDWNLIPLSAAVRHYIAQSKDFYLPLCAGDDYELCFTVPAEKEDQLRRKTRSLAHSCCRVGTIDEHSGLRIENFDRGFDLQLDGYEHFS